MKSTVSEKTVAQKLQIKPGQKLLLVNAPENYVEQLSISLPEDALLSSPRKSSADVIQVFVRSKKEMRELLPKVRKMVSPKGIIWATCPKGSSSMKSDVNRDIIRFYVEKVGLEAVAIFSVDDNWSALRLKIV